MVCKLIKRKNNVVGADGKNHVYTNYYLQFDNGVELPVVCRYYATKSTDVKEVEKWNRVNTANATRLDTLATLETSDKLDK